MSQHYVQKHWESIKILITTQNTVWITSSTGTLSNSAAQLFPLFFLKVSFPSPSNGKQLTVLCDKSQTTVHNDGHSIFSQLLVTEGPAVCACSQCNGRVPQFKVRPAEAVDVDCPAKKENNIEKYIYTVT